jgi:hypothetical protein
MMPATRADVPGGLTSTVDERSLWRLYGKLVEVLGLDEGTTLMELLVPERFEPGRRPLSLVPAPEEVTPTSSSEPRVDLRAELDRLTRALIIWMGFIVAITGIVAFLAGRFV